MYSKDWTCSLLLMIRIPKSTKLTPFISSLIVARLLPKSVTAVNLTSYGYNTCTAGAAPISTAHCGAAIMQTEEADDSESGPNGLVALSAAPHPPVHSSGHSRMAQLAPCAQWLVQNTLYRPQQQQTIKEEQTVSARVSVLPARCRMTKHS